MSLELLLKLMTKMMTFSICFDGWQNYKEKEGMKKEKRKNSLAEGVSGVIALKQSLH